VPGCRCRTSNRPRSLVLAKPTEMRRPVAVGVGLTEEANLRAIDGFGGVVEDGTRDGALGIDLEDEGFGVHASAGGDAGVEAVVLVVLGGNVAGCFAAQDEGTRGTPVKAKRPNSSESTVWATLRREC